MTRTNRSNQQGYMIILTMIIVFVLMGVGLTIASTVATNYASTKRNTYVDAAVSTSEAGISDTVERLRVENGFTGYPDVNGSRKQFYSNDAQGKAEYAVSVTDQPGDLKRIVSTGYVYSNPIETDGAMATNKKTIEAIVDVKQIPVPYTTLVGAGGLKMGFNANLPRGNIYVKGKVDLDASSMIGSPSQSVDLNVGNASCGTTNWPEICSDEPISIATLSFNPNIGGSIHGSVCATGQTNANRIFTGPSGTGLKPGCSSPPISMPTFDKKTFVEKINPANTISGGSLSCPLVGAVTHIIPANTRITGDLVFGTGFHIGTGICEIVIEGDVFVEGDVEIGTNGRIRVSDTIGTTRPVMVLNGQFKVGLSADVFLPNSSDIPAYVVSFKSTNNICSTSETIPSLAQQSCLTTSEAKASASINGPVTSFQCGFLIGGPRNMTGAIFYSYYSTILCNIGGVQFRAIGGQGMLIGVYGNVTAGNVEDSPFGQILTVPTYKLTSYRQLY